MAFRGLPTTQKGPRQAANQLLCELLYLPHSDMIGFNRYPRNFQHDLRAINEVLSLCVWRQSPYIWTKAYDKLILTGPKKPYLGEMLFNKLQNFVSQSGLIEAVQKCGSGSRGVISDRRY